MRYVLKISDIWYWTVCNPGLGDRTEAQFFFEDFIDGVEDSEVCLEIEVVYGHFIFSGAAVDAACGYGETERFGLFGAGRERLFSARRERGRRCRCPTSWRRRLRV